MTVVSPKKLVIASRESRLAMWQAENVRDRLMGLYPDCVVEILGMTTRGDQILDRALSKVGGKGLFVKELEVAMADGAADLAVHSLKDVPMDLPDGFALAAVLEREDPRDAFVSNLYSSLDNLPEGSIVGTSSLRRQALISARFPHLIIKPLRGNLDTRLRKLDDGDYAAIILAAAGLKRLGLSQRIAAYLEPEESLPAAGQGAMAIEIPDNRPELAAWLAPLNHVPTAQAVHAERAISKAFGGSCQIPLAAYAIINGVDMHLRAMVATPDGLRVAKAEVYGAAMDGAGLAQKITAALEAQNAEDILAVCKIQAQD
ncbi:hydroxymethylbilane synthase [Undibacterium sp. RuRC25W]|uniref:hydroxymethylbilane synthase n=1 Tax=Undibacterium sp. RuRC25W TaxID=3413047 RepID=UPI003BF287DA